MTASRIHGLTARADSRETSLETWASPAPVLKARHSENATALIDSARRSRVILKQSSCLALLIFINQSGAWNRLRRLLYEQRLDLVCCDNGRLWDSDGDISHSGNERSSNEKARSAEHHNVKRIIAKHMSDQRLKRERRDDFGDHYEEIEDTHVNAHPLWRQGA